MDEDCIGYSVSLRLSKWQHSCCAQPLIETDAMLEREEQLFLAQKFWTKLDVQRLRAGVRQKNIEARAETIRER